MICENLKKILGIVQNQGVGGGYCFRKECHMVRKIVKRGEAFPFLQYVIELFNSSLKVAMYRLSTDSYIPIKLLYFGSKSYIF